MNITNQNNYQVINPNFQGNKYLKVSQITPKGEKAKKVLGEISNFSFFRGIKEWPKRRETDLKVDLAYQEEVQKLVNQGEIRSNTLVMSDTGHDIPIFSQLRKNSKLNVEGTFYFPEINKKGSKSRIPAQLEKFSNELKQTASHNSDNNTLFLGLETHRIPASAPKRGPKYSKFDKPIDASQMPSAKKLREEGIEEVIYLKEAAPGKYKEELDFVKYDLTDYFKSLKANGIKVKCHGVDPRRGKK